jgi:hypothetical protein
MLGSICEFYNIECLKDDEDEEWEEKTKMFNENYRSHIRLWNDLKAVAWDINFVRNDRRWNMLITIDKIREMKKINTDRQRVQCEIQEIIENYNDILEKEADYIDEIDEEPPKIKAKRFKSGLLKGKIYFDDDKMNLQYLLDVETRTVTGKVEDGVKKNLDEKDKKRVTKYWTLNL